MISRLIESKFYFILVLLGDRIDLFETKIYPKNIRNFNQILGISKVENGQTQLENHRELCLLRKSLRKPIYFIGRFFFLKLQLSLRI